MADLSTVSVQEYVASVLPAQLDDAKVHMDHADYSVQYHVGDESYAVNYVNGHGKVVAGVVENPLITVSMDEGAWRSSITHDTESADSMVSPAKMSASRMEKIQNLKGKFNLELTKDSGDVVNSTTVFNGVETPEVTLMMKAADYAKILSGELNSQMAFMTGKLKFKGDMNFLMKLGALM